MMIKLITITKENTWMGRQKLFFAGFQQHNTVRLRWLVDWQEALWFDEESHLEPLLKRLHMISALDINVEHVEYTP